MTKVLGLVSFRIYPTHMGGQKGVAHFYAHLQNKLEVVLAVSTDNITSGHAAARKLLFANKKIYRNISRLGALKKLIRSEGIDLVIAEHSYSGWIGWLLKRSTHKALLIHSHNIESLRFRQMNKWWWKLYATYEGFIHRKADHNFFISGEDLQFALDSFRLQPEKCSVVTYGIERNGQQKSKQERRRELGIDPEQTILLFNGTLDYTPNYDAVVRLVDTIEPLLRQRLANYRLIITGNRAPRALVEKILSNDHILYAGYVSDVNQYYQAADLFLNPVANNSGVKTKLIEAIANNCTAVSTRSGASGIQAALCGKKLVTTEDGNWTGFAEAIVETLKRENGETPASFFEFYDWENITDLAAKKIIELAAHATPS